MSYQIKQEVIAQSAQNETEQHVGCLAIDCDSASDEENNDLHQFQGYRVCCSRCGNVFFAPFNDLPEYFCEEANCGETLIAENLSVHSVSKQFAQTMLITDSHQSRGEPYHDVAYHNSNFDGSCFPHEEIRICQCGRMYICAVDCQGGNCGNNGCL